jgi:hypothetical protein
LRYLSGGRGGEGTGTNGVFGVGVAGLVGIARDGCEVVRITALFPVEGGVGKTSVSAGVRRQVT